LGIGVGDMVMKRQSDRKSLTPQHTKGIAQINEIIKGLGFSQADIDAAKQDLSHYMPKEIFLDKYGNEKGWSLLYAVYAPQIVNDFFKEERGPTEKRQSPKSRRIQYEELAGDFDDYVQSVFMGYHDDQDVFKGGVRSVAVPSTANKINHYVYDPTQKDRRISVCPHCKVSFWSASAGNCDPKYKLINGKPLREWRDSADQAPEHIKFNPTTGERQEGIGYSYCGGRHEIYDITASNGTIDIEAAQRLSGVSWDELRNQDRIRSVAKDGALKHYLVDSLLGEVEKVLGGGAPYMKFGDEWVLEDGGKLFRECRYPIALKSPASVIHDRITRYTFNMSDKKSSGRSRKIKVYMCPKCPGDFKDINDITSEKGEGDRITEVQCDECGGWFDITTLPEEMTHTMQWLDPQVSLNVGMQDEEGHSIELIDTIPRRDIGYMEVEMAEIFDLFGKEIQDISRKLNIRGAEQAQDIFYDRFVNGFSYREITEKYLAGFYKLHYTECADCGYVRSEKSNPSADQNARYDQGLPIALTSCPNRLTDARHKVDIIAPVKTEAPVVNVYEQYEQKELRQDLSVNRPEEAVKKRTEQETASTIEDDNERRRYLGTNLIYHGRAPDDSGVAGTSYQIIDIERGISQQIPANDPGAYKGDQGVITRNIYQPAERLIKAILMSLKNNPRIRDKHKDVLDTLEKWDKELTESSTRFAKVKGFCGLKIR